MRWFWMAPGLLAFLVWFAPDLRGETEIDPQDAGERLEQLEDQGRQGRREASKLQERTRQLENQRKSLRESERVGHPFKSRRELRIELRGNESRGRWHERESRGVDFLNRRNRRDIRRLRRLQERG